MGKNKSKAEEIFQWRLEQKVLPNLKFSVEKVDKREFDSSTLQESVLVTDLTLNCDGATVEKRYFDSDSYEYSHIGDVLSFRQVIEREDSKATIKEVLLELDMRGNFQSPNSWKDMEWPKADEIQSPEDISGIFTEFGRVDIFAWPEAVYVLPQQNIPKDQWIDFYQICFWLQRAFDLQYTLDDELEYIGPEGENDFLINVCLLKKKTPLEAFEEPVEPSIAAATLGQLWEKYRTKYLLRNLSEYDYGTRADLDRGRDIANAGHDRREARKNAGMKRFVEATYPSGIEDVANTKVARRLIKALKNDEYPHYLKVFIENDVTPAQKTLTNRLSTLKKDGFIT